MASVESGDQQPGAPALEDDEGEAAQHDARAPGREQDAVARVVGVQRLLGVHDLDRDDQGEEHDRERLAAEQEPGDRVAPRVAQAGAQRARGTARAPRARRAGARQVAISTAITANEAASTASAVPTPKESTSRPPSAAPPMLETAKPMLSSALPARSSPAGCRTAFTAPRESPRAVSIRMPSTSASTSTSGSENDDASSASTAKHAASPKYSAGRTLRRFSWSSRAVSAGAAKAGRNSAVMNSAEVASGSLSRRRPAPRGPRGRRSRRSSSACRR